MHGDESQYQQLYDSVFVNQFLRLQTNAVALASICLQFCDSLCFLYMLAWSEASDTSSVG
jgi:hypothetical protein